MARRNVTLLIADEVRLAGRYRYYELAGGPPISVQVLGATADSLVVHFPDDRSPADIQALHGALEGPLRPVGAADAAA